MNLDKAHDLVIEKMREHGLIEDGWLFSWDKRTSSLGTTRHYKKLITLSKPLTALNSEDECLNTILHEIAHALAGPKANHNREWKQIFISIGGDGKRVASENVVSPPPKFIGTCVNGHQTTGNKRRNTACAQCCNVHNAGRYHSDYKWTWRRNYGQVER